MGGAPQLGIDVDWYISGQNETDQEVTQQVTPEMDYIVGLHANSVAISFPFYTKGAISDQVLAGQGTPTPKQLSVAVKAATAKGLRVTLRPLMDERNLGSGNWRGNIAPLDVSAWFQSYEAFLKPYLAMAQTSGVSTFIVGAELNSLAGSPEWNSLIQIARASFHRELGYSANWDVFHEGQPNPPVDSLGVDAYFPVSNGSSANASQLANSWNQWWSTAPSSDDLSKVVMDEVGIAAQQGAYQQPYSTNIANRPLDPAIQSRWFEAACRTVHERHLAGIYFWSVVIDPSQSFLSQPTSFIGRPGETAIKNCFSSFD